MSPYCPPVRLSQGDARSLKSQYSQTLNRPKGSKQQLLDFIVIQSVVTLAACRQVIRGIQNSLPGFMVCSLALGQAVVFQVELIPIHRKKLRGDRKVSSCHESPSPSLAKVLQNKPRNWEASSRYLCYPKNSSSNIHEKSRHFSNDHMKHYLSGPRGEVVRDVLKFQVRTRSVSLRPDTNDPHFILNTMHTSDN